MAPASATSEVPFSDALRSLPLLRRRVETAPLAVIILEIRSPPPCCVSSGRGSIFHSPLFPPPVICIFSKVPTRAPRARAGLFFPA